MKPLRIVMAAILLGLVVWSLIALRGNGADTSPPDPSESRDEARAVEVVEARRGEMSETTRLTGVFRGETEVRLASRVGGQVMPASLRVGDAVHRGQVLIRLEPTDAAQNLKDAQAAAEVARQTTAQAAQTRELKRKDYELKIAQAQSGMTRAHTAVEKAEIAARLAKSGSQSDIELAQKAVASAEASLAVTVRKPRPQERAQAILALQEAEVNLEAAQEHLKDAEYLHQKGGLTRVELKKARLDHRAAQSGAKKARNALDLLDAGPAPEIVEAARAQVDKALAALKAATVAAGQDQIAGKDLEAALAGIGDAALALQAAEGARAALAIPESQHRSALAQETRAKIAVRAAQRQLDDTTIHSPIDGLIQAVNVHPGEIVRMGAPLLTIVSTSGVYLEVSAPARIAGRLRAGQDAIVTADSFPGRRFQGEVRSVSPLADADGRSYTARIDVTSAGARFAPGAAARARVTVASYANALLAPMEALRFREETATLWVAKEGKAERRSVTVGLQDDVNAQILDGLTEGELVIVSGFEGLEPGQAVTVRRRE